MRRASIFRRLTRYQPGLIDPRENRLTEALASVLENVPALATRLGAQWTGASLRFRLSVRTQVPTVSGGFVDLELRGEDDSGRTVTIWVENKFGAGIHGNQLETYMRDIPATGSDVHFVVLLAPRDSVSDLVPEEVHRATWQDAAETIKGLGRHVEISGAERWLLAQFHQYLKEEALTNEDGLDAAQALSLERQAATLRTIDRLREITEARLSPELGDPISQNTRRTLTFWRNYLCPTPAGRDHFDWHNTAVLEWTFRLDSDFVSPGLPEPRDAYAFCAGVTFNQGALPSSGAPADWIQEISRDGFHFLGDRLWRGFKLLYPEQLLAEQTIEKQADFLGNWLIDAFRAIERHPLPR